MKLGIGEGPFLSAFFLPRKHHELQNSPGRLQVKPVKVSVKLKVKT